tara:strand:- start:307 stop:453 length:147 start_codon:yes stop_codon:yes gene_type:complete
MDFIFGFVVGYLCKEVFSYLKKLSDGPIEHNWDQEWDWMTPLQEDDLP